MRDRCLGWQENGAGPKSQLAKPSHRVAWKFLGWPDPARLSSDVPQLTSRRVISLSECGREIWRRSWEQPHRRLSPPELLPAPHAHLVQQGEANPLGILVICNHHAGQPVVPDIHVAEVLWAENARQKQQKGPEPPPVPATSHPGVSIQ